MVPFLSAGIRGVAKRDALPFQIGTGFSVYHAPIPRVSRPTLKPGKMPTLCYSTCCKPVLHNESLSSLRYSNPTRA